MDTETRSDSPGWDAIDRALASRYGSIEPQHFGTLIKYRLGGPDPLDGVSVYKQDGESPHFHFITYGLTDLYEKEGDDEEWSGYGFELSFRLARAQGEDDVPHWALNFLQNLARYVFKTGNVFEPGHYIDTNGPIASERETEIRALVFTDDPELSPIATPHGRMRFLQIVGVTLDELAAARRWDTAGIIGLLRARDPLLVTDLGRQSMLRDPEVAAGVEDGVRRDGSACGSLFLTELTWEEGPRSTVTIRLGASSVRDLVDLLPARLNFGRALTIASSEHCLVFESAVAARCERRDDALVVALPASAVAELSSILRAKRGEYAAPSAPSVRFIVSPSTIRDRDGNVVAVVGE